MHTTSLTISAIVAVIAHESTSTQNDVEFSAAFSGCDGLKLTMYGKHEATKSTALAQIAADRESEALAKRAARKAGFRTIEAHEQYLEQEKQVLKDTEDRQNIKDFRLREYQAKRLRLKHEADEAAKLALAEKEVELEAAQKASSAEAIKEEGEVEAALETASHTTESDLTSKSDADTVLDLSIEEDAEERERRLNANKRLWTYEGKRGSERPTYPFSQLFGKTGSEDTVSAASSSSSPVSISAEQDLEGYAYEYDTKPEAGTVSVERLIESFSTPKKKEVRSELRRAHYMRRIQNGDLRQFVEEEDLADARTKTLEDAANKHQKKSWANPGKLNEFDRVAKAEELAIKDALKAHGQIMREAEKEAARDERTNALVNAKKTRQRTTRRMKSFKTVSEALEHKAMRSQRIVAEPQQPQAQYWWQSMLNYFGTTSHSTH